MNLKINGTRPSIFVDRLNKREFPREATNIQSINESSSRVKIAIEEWKALNSSRVWKIKLPQISQEKTLSERLKHLLNDSSPVSIAEIKKIFQESYIIKNISQNYWNQFVEFMIREGRGGDLANIGIKKNQAGNYIVPERIREQEFERIKKDQIDSLSQWVDYVCSSDVTYPLWAKHWIIRAVTQFGKFDKKTNSFQNRERTTINPFPILNREALANAVESMSTYLKEQAVKKQRKRAVFQAGILSDKEFEELHKDVKSMISVKGFGKRYADSLIILPENSPEALSKTRGRWRKFIKGSAPDELVESLRGRNTGWCTANIETARTQLAGGDFYVYYSVNDYGEAIVPRLAIRIEGNKIAEVRGVEKGQNVDGHIGGILESKLNEFGEKGNLYKKRAQNMRMLSEIWNKNERGEILTKKELIFLYEFHLRIEGFGYDQDPRIEEIKNKRDTVKDLNHIFEGIDHWKGSLNLRNLRTAEGLKLPESIGGSLDLNSLRTAKELKLPESIHGCFDLGGLTTAEGLKLPEYIGGYLDLGGLTTAKGLNLPESIGGNLDLYHLTTAEGLKLPEHIGGNLDLGGLITAKGLKLPKSIGRNLYLYHLKTAEGLKLPNYIGGNLNLYHLKTAEGLKLPNYIGGNLNLYHLKTVEGLKLPKYIGGYLDLNGIRIAEGRFE